MPGICLFKGDNFFVFRRYIFKYLCQQYNEVGYFSNGIIEIKYNQMLTIRFTVHFSCLPRLVKSKCFQSKELEGPSVGIRHCTVTLPSRVMDYYRSKPPKQPPSDKQLSQMVKILPGNKNHLNEEVLLRFGSLD